MKQDLQALSKPNPAKLEDVRGQLHQAVQLLTAIGISFLDKQADDSHTNLYWDPNSKEFLSQTFGAEKKYQLGLSSETLECRIIHSNETLLGLSLNGLTLKQIASDLQFFLEDHGLPKDTFTMARHFELPDYTDRWEKPFDTTDRGSFHYMATTYTNAYSLLSQAIQGDARASKLVTWPHHFDMATLLTLSEGKSIGIGMSPGDSNYPVPYYYVNMWPYPTENQIKDKPLTFGKWHTEGWIGMILTIDEITDSSDSHAQNSMINTFLKQAIQFAEAVLVTAP